MAEAAVVEVSSPPVQRSAPTTEIHVTPATVTDPGPASSAPRPGSARADMLKSLRQKSGLEEPPAPATKKPATTSKPSPETTTTTEETTTETPETTTETPETTTTTPETTTTETGKKKPSPWKLVDEHKAARIKAETEAAELRKNMVPPEKVKEYQDKLAAFEKRAKEAEDHLAFLDYQKSPEYQEKYQKPYDDAWQRWMGELGELTVPGENGQDRPLSPKDLAEIVNLELPQARELAREKYGDFADDVMAARKEIRGLFNTQQKALAEAKAKGAERLKQMQEQAQQQRSAIHKEINDLWGTANKEIVEHKDYGKFFKPVDGDEEGNKRLQFGYEMADKAFRVNSDDPRLTPEQRAEVVRLHAAIRNRAAGFGRLAYQNSQLEAKIASLTAELNKYKGAEPGAAAPRTQTQTQQHMSAREQVFADLRKRAGM